LASDPREHNAVAAAPLPKPDEPVAEPGSDADGWALLEGLRRRLEDQAAQGRKTQAQVTQLAESIAALVAEQRRRSLWLNVNSFVAYLVFTLLCGTGCFLLYRSRAHELTAAREQAIGERDAAVRHADEALARAVARESADTKAWEVYQLLDLGKRVEAVAKLAALRDQPLSKIERAVLATRIHDSQVMEVDSALKAAAAALKAGRPGDAIKPLEVALTTDSPGAQVAMMHYYLGIAYAKTELAKAAAHLQAAVAGDVDQEDARFQLASVLDRGGAYAQARTEYDRFATAHPQSPFAMFAMRRSATLARLPAAPGPGGPDPVAAGAAPPLPGAIPGAAPAPLRPAAPAAGAAVAPPGATPGGQRAAIGALSPAALPGVTPPPPPVGKPGAAGTAPPAPPSSPAAVAPGPVQPPGSAAVAPHSGPGMHPAATAPGPVVRSVRPWLKPVAPAKPAEPAPPPASSAGPVTEPPADNPGNPGNP
jgi:tetratricopeptide (TPR) repeat protein